MKKAGGDSSSRKTPVSTMYRQKESKVAVGAQRVMRAGDWYVAEEHDWHQDLLQTGDVIEFPVYNEDSSNCGNLIARVTLRYKEDRYGRAFDATPLACSHKDFRGYMEKQLMKKSCRFHLCRCDGSECEWECNSVENYLHVDAFTRLKDHQATKKVAAWSRDKKKTYDIFDSMSVESESPADAPPAGRAKGKNSRAADEAEDDDPPAARAKGKNSRAADEAEEVNSGSENEEPPLRRRRQETSDASERKAKNSLDEVLGSLDRDVAAPSSNPTAMSSRPTADAAGRAAIADKVAELKARLAGRNLSGGGNAILAERALRSSQQPKASPPPKASGDAAAIRRLLSSFADNHDLAEDGLEIGGGELGNRRMLFRRIARDQPGKLSLQTIHDLRVKMEASDVDIPSDEYAPIFLRYLLQVYSLHNPVDVIGTSAFRELRHYAEIADGLMRGNLPQVLDLTTQAFKAKMLALEDGSWDTARWLQLIPEDTSASSVPEADVETARRIQAAKMKEKEREQKVKKGSGG